MNTKSLIEKFLSKKNISPIEVDNIVKNIQQNSKFSWRDLGDEDNNIPRVNIVTSAEHTLVERITNAMDACIEKKSKHYADILQKNNIIEVQKFLKENNYWEDDKEVKVEIYPLENIKKTNFIFTDNGVGIDNTKMPWTILRFNSSHKKDKKYLFGSFGQGGSTVCKYSEYTVIITNLGNKTSFTIIRLNSKEHKYQYLVDIKNKDYKYKKQTSDQPEENFLPPYNINKCESFGTSVIHIGYDFYKSSFVDYYSLLEENFFNSFLTYRSILLSKKGNDSRPMKGVKSRLENLVRKRTVEKGSTTTSNLNDGEKAKIIYYYLKEKK